MQGDIDAAAFALKSGHAVVFPTETVYGVGMAVAPGTSPEALAQIKRRDPAQPFQWLVKDAGALDRYAEDVPQWARRLASEYWPGPLTLVVRASDVVPQAWRGAAATDSAQGTIALRVPDHAMALSLIEKAGAPIATSSANVHGRVSPRAAHHVSNSMRQQAEVVLDGGLSGVGTASTIVDATGRSPVILRTGPVTAADILQVTDIQPLLADGASPSEDAVVKRALEVPSTDGSHVQRGFVWRPSDVAAGKSEPVATVQLVHGMIEFIDRYDALARFLASRGWIVYGCDLPYHADTAPHPDSWGQIPAKGGADLFVNDTLAVHRAGTRLYPEAPSFIIAHSMGTFVTRTLLGRIDASGSAPDALPLDLAGVVLSGTGGQAPMIARLGGLLAKLIGLFKGTNANSELLNGMVLGAYNKKFEPVRTSCDWLSRNEQNVDAYLDDPRNTFSFSIGGYITLMSLCAQAGSPLLAKNVPKSLPLLFVAGDKDPVGDMGKGVERAAEMYRGAGMRDVSVRLFADDRHEIFNEVDRDDVFAFVYDWLEQKRVAASA